jgi:DNA-directed RNA polymerase, mitochondrial
VLHCIGDLFKGAKDIQNWLNMSARLISKSIPPERLGLVKQTDTERKILSKPNKAIPVKQLRKEQMTSVIWTTPLGLPIVQPYRQIQRRQILTSLQTVYISDPNVPETVNPTKQATAFPPNFVHSLDATHMMLTALECRSQGLTFASVHDSYWTHASSIDDMSAVIRDTFVALHSSDVLARLRDEVCRHDLSQSVCVS